MWKFLPLCTFTNHKLTNLDLELYNQLRKAIKSRDTRLVENLIRKGASVNDILTKVDGVGQCETPLHLAVVSRCSETVKILLDNGADGQSSNWNAETPLIVAAKMQNTTLIDLLLSKDVQNHEDSSGFSHMHIACMAGNLENVKILLLKSQGKNLNESVQYTSMHWPGYTPLHFAVRFEQIAVAQYLLNCGADITMKDLNELTPLHLAHLQRNEMMIDIFLSAHKYTFTNPTNAQGLSHFHIACTRDDAVIVEQFVKLGVDVNLCTKDGWRPIHFAMYYECSNVINFLSKCGMHLKTYEVPSLLKRTYILQTQIIHSIPTAKQKGLDETCHGLKQLSGFYTACIQDDQDEVEETLLNEVLGGLDNLNIPIINGCTPLHLALRSESEWTTKALLDHGANFLLQDDEGKTALHIAFELNLDGILDKMIPSLNDQTPNLIDNKGLSLFHILCTRNDMNAVVGFIKKGVNIDMQVRSESAAWAGFAPIHFAIKHRQYFVVRTLLDHGANISVTTDLGLDCLEFALAYMNEHLIYREIIFKIIHLILSFVDDNKLENFDDRGMSPLHGSCIIYGDDPDMLQELLISHQDYINKPIKFSNKYCFSNYAPVDLAILCMHLRQAILLIENGADPCRLFDDDRTSLELGFSGGLGHGTTVGLAESLFSIVIASMEQCTPSYFYLACISGLSNVVESSIDKITDEEMKISYVNNRCDADQTPLHSLSLRKVEDVRKKQIVKLLLENGANVRTRNYMLQTPLHDVKKGVDLDITRMFLSHGADVNAQNIFGETPLVKWYAEFYERYDAEISDGLPFKNQIILLLESGFDINIADERNRTCLTIVQSGLEGFWPIRVNGEEPPLNFEIARIMLEHVKKLQIIGFHISDKNKQAYNIVSRRWTTYNETIFVERCEVELQSMMVVRIDHRTSLHDILFRNPDDMALYCENIVLREVVESDNFGQNFPIYCSLIKLQMTNGQARRMLLKKSAKYFSRIIAALLPQECSEKILRYLCDTDLENIISSAAL